MIPESGSAPGVKKTERRCCLRKDGKPVWDQTTIDRLWVTTQREAMIESGPPPAAPPTLSGPAPVPPAEKSGEPTAK